MPAPVVRLNKAHAVLCIPELVSQILQHLLGPEDDSNRVYGHVAPCLLVNRLWHHCGASIAWRSFIFEKRYEDFVCFSKAFVGESHLLLSNEEEAQQYPLRSQRTAGELVRLSMFNYFFPDAKPPPLSASQLQQQQQQQQHQKKPSYLLAQYQQSLRSLTLRKLKNNCLSTHLEEIGFYANRLERLDLYICDPLRDHALNAIALHGQLTHLSLAGCHRITDDAIRNVAEHCPRLEHLDVRACGNISDTAVVAVAQHCRQLKHLNVGRVRERERITGESILLIAKYTQVSVLGLAGCDVDDACMVEVARICGSALERVSLNSCARISNETVRACAAYCGNLSVLELKECRQVDDWELIYQLQFRRRILVTMCDEQEYLAQSWIKWWRQQQQEQQHKYRQDEVSRTSIALTV